MSADRVLTVLWVLVLAHIALTWLLAIRRGLRARRSDMKNLYFLPENPPLASMDTMARGVSFHGTNLSSR
jgi:hypothetical protein